MAATRLRDNFKLESLIPLKFYLPLLLSAVALPVWRGEVLTEDDDGPDHEMIDVLAVDTVTIPVGPVTTRADSDAGGAIGYFRPEDKHDDPAYAAEALRGCWPNTGNKGGQNWSDVMCAIDTAPATIPVHNAEGDLKMTTAVPRFIAGETDCNAIDNLALSARWGRPERDHRWLHQSAFSDGHGCRTYWLYLCTRWDDRQCQHPAFG